MSILDPALYGDVEVTAAITADLTPGRAVRKLLRGEPLEMDRDAVARQIEGLVESDRKPEALALAFLPLLRPDVQPSEVSRATELLAAWGLHDEAARIVGLMESVAPAVQQPGPSSP
jgi:hypothetical protein